MTAAICNPQGHTDLYGNCNAFDSQSEQSRPGRRAKWRSYANDSVRQKSFNGSPPELSSRAENLARFGFYYKGYADTIACFHCGLELNATNIDDPYLEHLTRAPNCDYILVVSSSVSEEYDVAENGSSDDVMITSPTDVEVNERLNGVPHGMDFEDEFSVEDKRGQNMMVTDTSLTRELAQVRDEISEMETRLQCKVCLSERVSVTFSPCGHLVTCQSCASRLQKCPLCRAFIRKKITTFLS